MKETKVGVATSWRVVAELGRLNNDDVDEELGEYVEASGEGGVVNQR